MKTEDIKFVAKQYNDGIYRFIIDRRGEYVYLSCENYRGFPYMYDCIQCEHLTKDQDMHEYLKHLQDQREREISAIES